MPPPSRAYLAMGDWHDRLEGRVVFTHYSPGRPNGTISERNPAGMALLGWRARLPAKRAESSEKCRAGRYS